MANSLLIYFLSVIALIESNVNDNAIGKNGEVGRYQITSQCLEDANRINKTQFKISDMKDERSARTVVICYLTHYGKQYTFDTGKQPSLEVYARIWNGGPYGYKKECTIPYWIKFKNAM